MEAVCCELVSTCNSLFAGKKQGISTKSGVLGDLCRENLQGFSALAGKFPMGKNREFFRS